MLYAWWHIADLLLPEQLISRVQLELTKVLTIRLRVHVKLLEVQPNAALVGSKCNLAAPFLGGISTKCRVEHHKAGVKH
jgi:hypothetical protein